MAKKSKTQRAKASARRAEKRDAIEEVLPETEAEGNSDKDSSGKAAASQPALSKNAAPKKVKEPGRIATFFKGVRSEMRRVTWPTRTDVIRWSGVVVGALIFFGVFVFVLDNIFPQLLVLLGSINPTGA